MNTSQTHRTEKPEGWFCETGEAVTGVVREHISSKSGRWRQSAARRGSVRGTDTAYRPHWTRGLSCPLWLLRLLEGARLPHRLCGSRPRPQFPLLSRTAGRPQRTSRSAWYSTTGAIVSPRALATFRLMTNSIFEFVSTGSSAGFVPLKILSTRRAACRPVA
jgi:hypothetical protein